MVEKVGLYWHFVDLVWVFVFILLLSIIIKMERDDLVHDHNYSVRQIMEAHGVAIRKTIWRVTIILSLITLVEVLIGALIKQYTGDQGADNSLWPYVKVGFIVLTVVKAAYIVLVFMHLGDERKNFKMVILVPYILFIVYLILFV